jgi:uncharacterized delta-60 repeat protein
MKLFFLHRWILAVAFFILMSPQVRAQANGPGSALNFFGTITNYMIIPTFTNFPSTAITVEFWMKTSDSTKDGTPFSYSVTNGNDNSFLIFNYRNFDIQIAGRSTNTAVSATNGVWTHIAVSWRSSDGQTKLYKDGVQVFSVTNFATGLSITNGGTLVFGQDQDVKGGGFASSQAFLGQADEVRMWKAVRTANQIQQNKNLSLVGNESNLVLYHRWDEGSGNIVASSAGTHSGTLSNAAWAASLAWVTSTAPVGIPLVITNQPQNQTNLSGTTATFSVGVSGTAPFYQWQKDSVDLVDGGIVSGATTATLTLTGVSRAEATNYSVVVSNFINVVTSSVVTLTVRMPDVFNPNAGSSVYAIAEQLDGRILLGGTFMSIGGANRSRLARVNSDGTLDQDFFPNPNSDVNAIVVQEDGKILVGGTFTNIAGASRSRLARLDSEGDVDANFTPVVSGEVNTLTAAPDGSIYVGGAFTNINGVTRNRIARLNSDGTLDASFNPDASGVVNSIALQLDGKILLGGTFTNVGGVLRNRIARLNPDGTLDTNFNPNASNAIQAIALQPDGKILLGGIFSSVGGVTRNRLARIETDGSLDTNFNPNLNSPVNTLALQSDGMILTGGTFSSVGGTAWPYLARLHPDGSLDASFAPDPSSTVDGVAVQADGKILVGGSFSTMDNVNRSYIARLSNDTSPTEQFELTRSVLSWNRGGSAPEIWTAAFEHSIDGSTWTNLGTGTRISGGWQLTNVSLPGNFGYVRGRGNVSGGYFNGSSWLVDAEISSPHVLTPPANLFVTTGSNAVFTVVADGTGPLGYQWRKNATNLVNDAKYSGVTTATLTVIGSQNSDAGSYDVVITNRYGSVISSAATLTVTDIPVITSLSPGFFADAGTTASLVVTTTGTTPVGYRWQKGGTNVANGGVISGALTATLKFTGLVATNAGNYRVILTNASGSVASSFVALTVISGYPVSRTNAAGTTATFTITATGAGPLTYQWKKGKTSLVNGGNITGANAATLVLTAVTQNDATNYSITLTDSSRSLTSQSVSLTVIDPPVITTQPPNRNENAGETTSFSVIATGTAPLRYQWFHGSTALSNADVSGATNSIMSIFGVLKTNEGVYTVVVSNFAGVVTSSNAVLTVKDPYIFADPDSRSANAGNQATFTVHAEGTTPLIYQWRKNGTVLTNGGSVSGAATSTLTLTGVLKNDQAAYVATVSNAFGVVTSAVANLTVNDPVVTASPVGQNKSPGQNVTFNVSVAGTAPLKYQWQRNGVALPGATASSLTLTNLQSSDIGGFRAIVSNSVGTVTSAVAVLSMNLASLDAFNPNVSNVVYTAIQQRDGKILIGGIFTSVGGITRNRMARLHSNGTLDTNFNPNASSTVEAIIVQPDENILIAGSFTTIGGTNRSRIARLLSDGSVDTSFTSGVTGGAFDSMALQPDGKILVGGSLTGGTRSNLFRLHTDGSIDTNFTAKTDDWVTSLAVQPDGKILIGGWFSTVNNTARDYLARLNADGSLDTSFNPDPNTRITSLVVQPDGKILVGGYFSTIGGTNRTRFVRLHPDGTVDLAFKSDMDGAVYSMALQANGKIIAGGAFSMVEGAARNGLAQLSADGQPIQTFAIEGNLDADVYGVSLQADGGILVGGAFTNLGGVFRNRLGRISATDAATQQLSLDGTLLRWEQGGSAPAFWRTSFEHSTDGTTWTNLGSGTNVASSAWQTGFSLPLNVTNSIRARGYYAAGYQSASASFVETIFVLPAIQSVPTNATPILGSNAVFSIAATGSGFSYQWKKNSQTLFNGGNISGATNATLTIAGVAVSDEGNYSVTVTSGNITITRSATLTVARPVVLSLNASNITHTSAQLRASVNPNGVATTVYFEHGDSTNYGGNSLLTNIGNGLAPIFTTTTLSGLSAGATIHYRAIAFNSLGVVYGDDVQFQTLPPPFASSFLRHPDNRFEIGFTAGAGLSYTVQASTNLQQWNDVTNIISSSNGAVIFIDATPTNRPGRFFRLRNP